MNAVIRNIIKELTTRLTAEVFADQKPLLIATG
jgi:hypothetical protein